MFNKNIILLHLELGSQDSAVGIATRKELDGPDIESRWGRDSPHSYRPALGKKHPPIQRVLGLSGG